MSKYVDSVYLETEECYRCGMTFAMTRDFQNRRRNDHKSFYCPRGHSQYYAGKSETQKLKVQLSEKQRQLDQQISATANARVQRDSIHNTYNRMRDRVKNGVCPCCNRSFQNLRDHMKTQHPEFGSHDVLKTMRVLFGLSQGALAKEVGVPANYVSLYERQKPMPEHAKIEIESWMESNE